MKTIDELVYYCKEPDPVGALMLTGEWGCGKTYLIEHELKKKLENTHIFVRVSLFGISNIDVLNQNVKKQWVSQCTNILGKIQNHEKAITAGRTIFGSVSSFVPVLKDVKDTILSVNPLDYITIKPNIEEKKVILVFDDLERSKLSTIDVLGCINEYCENYHFNTIIIANEDRISDDENAEGNKDFISYAEIKEKIVARTVCHRPEFDAIIHSLLRDREWFNAEYKKFLLENESLILGVFETDPVKKDTDKDSGNSSPQPKPHNIRSLKCALKDFYRVYGKLVKYSIPDKEKYLYSFIAYTIATKAGIAVEGDYGFLFSDEDVRKIYPFFNSSTLLSNVRSWILYGEWNEELLDEELRYIVARMKTTAPKDVLKNNRFIELEEDIITEGFSGLLEDCYSGSFTLNDYVYFVENSCWSREYNIELPESINWNKVNAGIQVCFKRYIEENELENYTLRIIGKDSRRYYTEEELKAYDMIAEFRDNNVVMFENNKKLYVTSLGQEGLAAFRKCQHKRFKVFDNEMAGVTVESFKNSSQSDKAYFPGYFEDMWEKNVISFDIDLNPTKNGLVKLLTDLKELKAQYGSNGKNIAAVHTETFIKTVDKLINRIDERLTTNEGQNVETESDNDEDDV